MHGSSAQLPSDCRCVPQGTAAKYLGNCVGWISTTKPIFGSQPVCLTLTKNYPANVFNAKKGSVYNPVSNAYKVGTYSKGCACPARV